MGKATKGASLTTAQQLGSIVKSARDTMRKDKGLNGDLDRLPMLTWIMFLKFLDDMERIREEEAILAGERFRPAIEPPYRWRDWAANGNGHGEELPLVAVNRLTGDDLIAFINNDEAVRPDGERGPGLFFYLRSLQGADGGDRRDVIATVFRETRNRMQSGYLLRDVINKVNGIHFTSSEEIHTLSALYESLLKEMRDAAGDSGEFYTPRPVIRFMVEVTNPRLGETVMDPACGTGGFLVEAFTHLAAQCQTVEDREILQARSVLGGEAKSLPYLLAQMNLLLHGLEYPKIDPGNSLRVPLREIGDRDRVDVILTNPPFGGEEERGILGNFPDDKQTAETTLLFLQLIMRKLRRSKPGYSNGGRCGVVVSDGLLSSKGVHARVKSDLIRNFNLHTIVRLPKGVFAPYTPIKTNLLFFDASGPTEGVWFYELPSPIGRQMYTKTKPLMFDEFRECLSWWNDRRETRHAWYAPVNEIEAREMDLDMQNPHAPDDLSERNPAVVINVVEKKAASIQTEVQFLKHLVHAVPTSIGTYAATELSKALSLRKDAVKINDDEEYQLITVQLHARGIIPRVRKLGAEIKTKQQQIVRAHDLVVAEIDAKMGGYGIVPPELAGAIVSGHYFVYTIDTTVVDMRFLDWYLRSGLPELWIQPFVKGSTNYAAIRQTHFPLLEIRLPPLPEQIEFAEKLANLDRMVGSLIGDVQLLSNELGSLVPAMLLDAFKQDK